MNAQINTLVDKLEESFKGKPWYGESLMQKLNRIEYSQVNVKPEGLTHSIAELVQHLINWRKYLIEKLKGDLNYRIELNSNADWVGINIHNKGEWISLLDKLTDTQDEIIKILRSNDDEFIELTIPGKKYAFKTLIEGIIQHDIYHAGQIALIAKQSKI